MTHLKQLRTQLQFRHWAQDENGLAILTKQDIDNPRFGKVLNNIFNTIDKAISAEPTITEWEIIQILSQYEADSIEIIAPNAEPKNDMEKYAVIFRGTSSNYEPITFYDISRDRALHKALLFFNLYEDRY